MDSTANEYLADVLAIAAHRDDVEQSCGGSLLRMAARGLRTAILDLTQGEAGTRGSADGRAREAAEAARQGLVAAQRAYGNYFAGHPFVVEMRKCLR